jgi:hypothetical protein
VGVASTPILKLETFGYGRTETDSMLHTLGWLGVILLGLVFVINGAFMLFSPRAYFRLPDWLAPKSSHITEKRYGSGWGAIELRICGAAFLGTIVWVVYDGFLKSR